MHRHSLRPVWRRFGRRNKLVDQEMGRKPSIPFKMEEINAWAAGWIANDLLNAAAKEGDVIHRRNEALELFFFFVHQGSLNSDDEEEEVW